MTWGQYSRRSSCWLLNEHGALHVWQCFWLHLMIPSAFTSLPDLESLPLGSNGLFHMLTPPPGFTTPVIGLSCATQHSCLEQSSLDVAPDILIGSISHTCRRTHMRVEDLEIIAREGL